MSRHVSTLAALVLLLAACSDEPEAVRDTGRDESSYSHLPAEGAPIAAGAWAVQAKGTPGAPLVVLEVPDGLWGASPHVWTNQGRIGYWSPAGVYVDPCADSGEAPDAGDSVDDLVQALEAQKLTTTTEPEPVSLGGYDGVYVELSTALAAADIARCRDDVLALWGDEAPILEEPSVERLWILDVAGKRVVLDLDLGGEATDESVRFFTDIVETATFVAD
ncbi:MAG TPA: hypothetical protein VFK52_08610 [Nocardioidaceae bacterium]|nr:hypothetical protein [Nocardioidaceae bacterium]